MSDATFRATLKDIKVWRPERNGPLRVVFEVYEADHEQAKELLPLLRQNVQVAVIKLPDEVVFP